MIAMSALSSIVLADRQSPPVNHTFVPVGIDRNGVATLVEGSGVPIGQSTVSVGLTEKTNTFDAEVRFTVPVVQTQTINGVSSPVVVRRNYAKVVFTWSKYSDQAERQNLQGLVESSMKATQAMLHDMIVKLSAVY